MRTVSLKVLGLVGLMVTSAPLFLAQTPSAPLHPFGLTTADSATAAESSVNSESLMGNFKGQYSFAVRGALVGKNIISREQVAIGSIVVDGKGNVTSGEEDVNSANGSFSQLPLTGTYTLSAQGTGTLTLRSSQMTQVFSLFVPVVPGRVQNASLVEIDGIAGTSGLLNKQAVPTALDGSYNLSLEGETFETSGTPNAVSLAGTLNVAQGITQGSVGFFVGEAANGTSFALPSIMFPPTATSAPDANGRFTLTASLSQQGPMVHFVGYALDATHVNLIVGDRPSELSPLLSGNAVK